MGLLRLRRHGTRVCNGSNGPLSHASRAPLIGIITPASKGRMKPIARSIHPPPPHTTQNPVAAALTALKIGTEPEMQDLQAGYGS